MMKSYHKALFAKESQVLQVIFQTLIKIYLMTLEILLMWLNLTFLLNNNKNISNENNYHSFQRAKD